MSNFIDKVTFAEPPGCPGPLQKGWEIRGFESPTTCGIPFASGEVEVLQLSETRGEATFVEVLAAPG